MVNRSSAIPLYHQIKQDLLDQIQSGFFSEAQPLPSEKELQELYGVSSITVRRAMGDLEAAGYVTRQPGRGTFALPARVRQRAGKIGGFPNDLAAQGFRVKIEVLDYFHDRPPADVARRLGITRDISILQTIQVVHANEEPVAMGYAYHNYPDHITFSREELTTGSVLSLLAQKYGIVPPHAERSTELAFASNGEAEILRLETGDAIIEVNLTVFDSDENGLYHVRSLYRGDRYVYHESIRI